MSNFVNLLDIIYPVHSMHITTSTVSPATSIGGTWTQIKDGACIAAYKDTSGYTGSKTISISQMPRHNHPLVNNLLVADGMVLMQLLIDYIMEDIIQEEFLENLAILH